MSRPDVVRLQVGRYVQLDGDAPDWLRGLLDLAAIEMPFAVESHVCAGRVMATLRTVEPRPNLATHFLAAILPVVLPPRLALPSAAR